MYIIGGGPSVKEADLSLLHNKIVVGVNNAFLLGDWVDACWFGDSRWWDWHEKELASYGGLIASCAPKAEGGLYGVHYFRRDKTREFEYGLSSKKGSVCWNGNSGASCIDFVSHLGARTIILLGFDMQPTPEGVTHWHGCHKQAILPKRVIVSPYPMFLKCFPVIAKDATARGIQIYNASLNSKITEFPKEALESLVKRF